MFEEILVNAADNKHRNTSSSQSRFVVFVYEPLIVDVLTDHKLFPSILREGFYDLHKSMDRCERRSSTVADNLSHSIIVRLIVNKSVINTA